MIIVTTVAVWIVSLTTGRSLKDFFLESREWVVQLTASAGLGPAGYSGPWMAGAMCQRVNQKRLGTPCFLCMGFWAGNWIIRSHYSQKAPNFQDPHQSYFLQPCQYSLRYCSIPGHHNNVLQCRIFWLSPWSITLLKSGVSKPKTRHNILEPVLEWPSKKESKTIVDSKNLVEPLKPRWHVSLKWK